MRLWQRSRKIFQIVWRAAIVVVLIVLFVSGCSRSPTKPLPMAKDGMIDLTGWDWQRDGIVPLAGAWRFRWHGTMYNGQMGPYTTLEVPGMWNKIRDGNGRSIPNQGYAEYRLTILHRPQADLMAIRLPNISTAYEIYINEELQLTLGKIGSDAAHAVPSQMPATIYLNDFHTTVTDIRLVVGNFHHRQGGVLTDLLMGRADQIDRLQTQHEAQEFIVFGCLIMIGMYHIGLYVLRRKESANLFFALLCLFVSLRMGLIGEAFLLRWFPVIDWEAAVRLEYIAFVLSGWSGFAYYQRMYPSEFRRIWVSFAGGAAAVLSVFAAVLPTLLFTSWLSVYQAYLLAICAMMIAGLVLSGIRRREGARLALVGVAGMVATVVNDMLFYNGWWRSVDLVPFGLLFLIFMNSFIIALRSSRTFERAEQLSAELKMWNERLEERITERKEELHKSYLTLEEAKTELERIEQSRRQLVSNISHDLRTPITLLQGYLEALRDGVISDEQQRDATIRLMLGKVEGLNGLIHDLFELSVLEARRVELSLDRLTLEEWRERLQEQYMLDLREKGILLTCALATAEDVMVQITVDMHRMDRVFANLIFNAVRYTPEGGTIRITLRRLPDGRTAEICVEDSGTGMHPEDLPHIFERFYKKDKSRHSSSGGSGLGLAISREIVELHGGSIGASNREGGGGIFRITLPMN